ncbi:MAG: MATE family efflux transporter [Clostridia bacterium]|nr:MATE family efflux transporter [Clostridia bacterium]
MERDLTRGKPMSLILRFCLPLFAGNLFQQLYNLVDTIIVGQFVGKTALSAVGSVGSLSFMVIGTIIGLCSGFAIPVAQAFGAEDRPKMRRIMAHITYLAVGLGAVISVVTVMCTDLFLQAMNTPEDIYKDAHDYIIIIFAGIPATLLYNITAGVVRSVGDSKTPLYFLVLSSLLNIALDLIFVLKLNMGVSGVATATVISQAVSGFLCLLVIKKKFKLLHFSREDMPFDFKICKKLLTIGIPMALQFSITAVGTIMVQSCVNILGSDIITAVTVGSKVVNLIGVPSETIGITMATYCGQNLGAGKIDRIRKGIRCAVLLGALYSFIAFFISKYGGPYASLMFLDKSETEILSTVAEYFGICAWYYIALSLIFIFRNALQGMGYSLIAMSGGIFELVARAIVAYGFITKFGFIAACYSNPVAWIAADILLLPAYFYIMNKLKKKQQLS